MKKLVGTHDWQRYDLTVQSDRGPLKLSWSNVLELARWQNMQAGLFIKGTKNTLQLFFEEFPRWSQDFWNGRQRLGTFDLLRGAKIIDIGSGVAVADLLLSQYIPEIKFWLVDYDNNTWGDNVYYSDKYPCYNSWDPVKDAIYTSNLDPNRFVMQDPSVDFPEEVDCVTSYFSWCFHYPKEAYWDRAYNALKPGGKLVLDVRLLYDRDTIEEITEQMRCKPVMFPYPALPNSHDGYGGPNPYVSGYRCLWTKK